MGQHPQQLLMALSCHCHSPEPQTPLALKHTLLGMGQLPEELCQGEGLGGVWGSPT